MSWNSENLSLISSCLGSPEKRPMLSLRQLRSAHRRPDSRQLGGYMASVSLWIFLGFQNQRLWSHIQASSLELPGPDSEAFTISWKTPKQVFPYERPSPELVSSKALSPRGPDRPKVWTLSGCSLNWTETQLTLLMRAPSYFHRAIPPPRVCPQAGIYLSPWPWGPQLCPYRWSQYLRTPSFPAQGISVLLFSPLLWAQPSPPPVSWENCFPFSLAPQLRVPRLGRGWGAALGC